MSETWGDVGDALTDGHAVDCSRILQDFVLFRTAAQKRERRRERDIKREIMGESVGEKVGNRVGVAVGRKAKGRKERREREKKGKWEAHYSNLGLYLSGSGSGRK